MGMAMTILSFRWHGCRHPGAAVENHRSGARAGLGRAGRQAYRNWDRGKKYYESLRLVYEIQQTLRDWNETDDGQSAPKQSDGGKPPARKPTAGALPAGGAPAGAAMEGPIESRPQGIDIGNQKDGRVRR